MLLGPGLVGVAAAHVPVGTLDTDRSHVDVAEGDRDVKQRRRRVHDPGVLHDGARLIEVGEQQHDAAARDDDAEQDHAAPEPGLLAGVEAPRRDVLAAREERPRLAEPHPVVGLGQVVAQPHEDHGDHGDDEQRRDEVMQVLAERREPGEQRVADDRQQQVLAEQHDQAGDAEHAEADGGGPVHYLLEGAEAANQAAARPVLQLDRPLPEVKREHRERDQHHQPAAVEGHRPVAELAPCLARGGRDVLPREARRRLHQHVGLAALDGGEVLLSRFHVAPDRRVVAGLLGLALLLLLGLGLSPCRAGELHSQRQEKNPHLRHLTG